MSASSSRENFKWSEEMAYKLAKLVLRHKGYKRTELTMKDKWSSILSELKRDEVFHDLNISWESLQNAFRRNCERRRHQ
jgi:predicted RNA-binding protein associated with RNAse of E/G family